MKHILLFSILLLMSFSSFSQENKAMTSDVTTYYFIRHAEKDRSNPSERNPHLKESGLKRAENWSNILANIHFDVIYSTDYFRTKETAQPTADNNNLKMVIYDPNTVDADAFNKDNRGKTVLIVGHSNTTPEFVNAVIGQKKYEEIDDANNGNIYIVTIIDGKIADQVLTIN